MASDAVEERSARPLLSFGPVERLRVQVGYRTHPDGPAYEQFLLDLPLPEQENGEVEALDESAVLAALEPVLQVSGGAPRHYSLHQHRWHTSWGASPGTLELGLLVTTGTRTPTVTEASRDGATEAFSRLMDLVGRREPVPISREVAVRRALSSTATAYAVEPTALSLSAEEHHASANAWTVHLRTTAGDEFQVVVGLVDGYAGSVRVRHAVRVEVSDSLGAE